jgi:uncharacterized membrane protein YkvA (DUF1232 family)
MPEFIKKNWTLILVAIYVLSPVDLIPEAIPGLGNILGSLDDATLVLLQGIITYKNSKKK